MIKIKKNRLIISLKDDEPKTLLRELRKAIVAVIQENFIDSKDVINEDLNYANFRLIELLKELMKKPRK